MMKIQLFEHGTLFIDQNRRVRMEIATNKVLAECPEDVADLQEPSDYFFILKEIKKVNDRIILEYETEEGFKPLVETKSYSTVLRLTLVKELLVLNPLFNFKEKVLIHPRNIFFNNEKKMKFLYRSNQWLPYDHADKLEQYKLLILSLFSRFSYEKYRREKSSLLKKETDPFLFHVENATSVKRLEEIIATRLQKEEIQHFFGLEALKQKGKKQKNMIVGVSTGICILCILFALFLQQSTATKVQKVYAIELKRANEESSFYKLLSQKKYDEALSFLKKSGASKQKIARLYYEKGDYQKAIDLDKDLIKPVVETLYKANKQEDIMSLQAESDYLDTEKDIVGYNYSTLLSKQEFSKDKGQQFRIGQAFALHGDLEDAKDLNQTLKNRDLSLIIQKKELEQQAAKVQKQINDLNKQKDTNQDNKKKQIASMNKELLNAKTEMARIEKEEAG